MRIKLYNQHLDKTISVNLKKNKVNILIGRNGYGKTTFIKALNKYAEDKKYNVVYWNDNEFGRDNGRQRMLMSNNMEGLSSLIFRSEGESLIESFASFFLRRVGRMVRDFENKKLDSDVVFLLVDQLDSGLDIHQINEIKEIFKDTVITDMKDRGLTVYLVVSANSYELARGELTLDPVTGKYVVLKSIEDFSDYIDSQY